MAKLVPSAIGETDQVLGRLDILISLTLDQLAPEGTMQVASKIQRLTEIGLSPREIARIVGKPGNYVTATQQRQRRAVKRRV
jgi:hypothetical protein